MTNRLKNSIKLDFEVERMEPLFATEEDLASHTRVEDYLFVPAILALEKQL